MTLPVGACVWRDEEITIMCPRTQNFDITLQVRVDGITAGTVSGL